MKRPPSRTGQVEATIPTLIFLNVDLMLNQMNFIGGKKQDICKVMSTPTIGRLYERKYIR